MTDYFTQLTELFAAIQISDKKGVPLKFEGGRRTVVRLIRAQAAKGRKVVFIGNGGSSSIASHMVTDLVKNAHIPALSFTDPSLLTCVSNDLGYDRVYEKPVEVLAGKGDVLFAISSSGKSANILRASAMARKKGCYVVTFSGFKRDNPLRRAGDVNFYVPSDSYGYVETAHLALCHSIIDVLVSQKIHG